MSDLQQAVRDLVRAMAEKAGLSPTALAKKAGLAPSTVNRFLNQEVKHIISTQSLAKLSEASGMPVPETIAEAVKITEADPDRAELIETFEALDEQERAALLMMARVLARQPEPDDRTSVNQGPRRRRVA